MEEHRFTYAEAMYEGRWASKTSLKDCGYFYRESKKIIANPALPESQQMFVWDLLVQRAAEIDMQPPFFCNGVEEA